MKKIFLLILFIFLTEGINAQHKEYNFSNIRIGIVSDGPSEINERVFKMLTDEITSLLAGQSDAVFPADKVLTGNWTMEEVRRMNDKLLNDGGVDIIITMGVLSSYDMCKRGALPKPVIAPFIANRQLEKIDITANQTSGVKNLCYLDLSGDPEDDLIMMRNVFHFKNLAFIRNKLYTQELNPGDVTISEIDSTNNLSIEYFEIGSTLEEANEVLSKITNKFDAVYVSTNYQMTSEVKQYFYDGLIQKKIPSFTFDNKDVSLGALACIYPDIYPKLCRRIALNVQDITLGVPASTLPVNFIFNKGYVLNITTLNKIDLKEISWDVLMESEMVGLNDTDPYAELLDIKAVMLQALDSNTELQAEKLEIKKSETDVISSRSKLLPFLGVEMQGLLTRESEFQPSRTFSGAISVEQNIYSNLDWANYSAQKKFLESIKTDFILKQLNLNSTSAEAYINFVLARKLFFISIDFLKSTRANLEIAKFRKQTGKADQSEVYRWESEVASGKKLVTNTYSILMKSVYNIQQISHISESRYYALSDVTIDNPGLLTSNEKFLSYFHDPIKVDRLTKFMIDEALTNSPILKKYELQIDAQKTVASGIWNSNFIPVFSVFGNYSRVFSQSEIEFPLPDYNYQLGVKLSLPIFSGFSLSASEQKVKYEITQLELSKKTAIEKITTNVKSIMVTLQSDLYAIKQTGIAKSSASNSLDLINIKYLRGAASLLDLLDAQRNYYNTMQDEANVYYSFLNDYFVLQNALSRYDMFLSPLELAELMNRIDKYMEG